MPGFRLLHTNDLHGRLDDNREAALQTLRAGCDLYFDSGDAVKSGNLAIPLTQEDVWARFARLNITASVIGNRETHLVKPGFTAKLAGATHPILCANLRTQDGECPLPGELIVEAQGLKIGVFAVSVPMVTERMAARFASAYLWGPPIPAARECVERLKPDVDVVIGLTHIGHREDLSLAEKVAGIDILLTGHSHTILEKPVKIGETWICQGGSHGRYAGVYEWRDGDLSGDLVPLA